MMIDMKKAELLLVLLVKYDKQAICKGKVSCNNLMHNHMFTSHVVEFLFLIKFQGAVSTLCTTKSNFTLVNRLLTCTDKQT